MTVITYVSTIFHFFYYLLYGERNFANKYVYVPYFVVLEMRYDVTDTEVTRLCMYVCRYVINIFNVYIDQLTDATTYQANELRQEINMMWVFLWL